MSNQKKFLPEGKSSFPSSSKFSSQVPETSISWFPGHMKKTSDLIKRLSKKVDVIIEILDARIPCSGFNPLIREYTSDLPRLIILNKSDLANTEETRKWKFYFQRKKYEVLILSCSTMRGKEKKIQSQVETKLGKLLPCQKKSSKSFRTLSQSTHFSFTAMVCGIPNVGKSTFINLLVGKRKVKVGNYPGITMDKQLLKIESITNHSPWALLDMPGLLKTKLNAWESFNLSLCGTIKDGIFDKIELACKFLKDYFFTPCKQTSFSITGLIKFFDLKVSSLEIENQEEMFWLEQIARRRGYFMKNKEINYLMAAETLIKDFRDGKLGCITLEKVDDIN